MHTIALVSSTFVMVTWGNANDLMERPQRECCFQGKQLFRKGKKDHKGSSHTRQMVGRGYLALSQVCPNS